MHRLDVLDARALDLRELSALTIRRAAGGRAELLAVGDHDAVLLSAELTDAGVDHVARHDLRPAVRGVRSGDGNRSGFEGVATAGDGTVVLLQEEQARLLVLTPDLSQVTTVLDLVVTAHDPDLERSWRHLPNARGEGLLLLARGHVLVAKQREPACLIEFGPPADPPIGVTTDTVLAPEDTFEPRPGVSALATLAVWRLTDEGADLLPTLNDLARGPDGRVYALSAGSRVVARLEKRLEPGERARPTDAWELDHEIPDGHDGRDGRAEGLAVDPSGRALVGIDTGGHDGVNLVVCGRLDPAG